MRSRLAVAGGVPVVLGFLTWGLTAWAQTPLGTAFTYQGRLTDAGLPANGSLDLQFKLFDALTVGNQVGSTLTRTNVAVSAGLFTVSLDFGAVFSGNKSFLEIGVRPGGTSGAFTLFSERQELTPAPNAVFSGAGRSVAARPTTTAAFDATSTGFSSVPMTSNTWTQAADEVDMLLGTIRLTSQGCTDPNGPRLFLQYFIGGQFAGEEIISGSYFATTTLSLPTYSAIGTPSYFASGPLTMIPEPGTPTARTLTVTARDYCTTGHFHIEFLKFSVVRFM